MKVTIPPNRIRTKCCKLEEGMPPGRNVYFLDLDHIRMTCKGCGREAEFELVPADSEEQDG